MLKVQKKKTLKNERHILAQGKKWTRYILKFLGLAKLVVETAYPKEDVATCKGLKRKYGQPLDVVAKDKCFYFSYAKENLEEDENEDDRNVSEHFDFGLYGE
jgi:hypothetical protein